MDEAFVREVRLLEPEGDEQRTGHPWDLPAIGALTGGLALDRKVTYLIGENGSGKSTLLEAIAVAAGLNPEGGSSNFRFSTRDSHSELWRSIRLVRGVRRPRTDFFLRAESLFTTATYLEELPDDPLRSYGGRSLHEQSHGESFLTVMVVPQPRPRARPRHRNPAPPKTRALAAAGCLPTAPPCEPPAWPLSGAEHRTIEQIHNSTATRTALRVSSARAVVASGRADEF